MSEHHFEDELEERDDVVDRDAPEDRDEPNPGEPWAKTSSGNADDVTDS
jgi:hypothetical protein